MTTTKQIILYNNSSRQHWDNIVLGASTSPRGLRGYFRYNGIFSRWTLEFVPTLEVVDNILFVLILILIKVLENTILNRTSAVFISNSESILITDRYSPNFEDSFLSLCFCCDMDWQNFVRSHRTMCANAPHNQSYAGGGRLLTRYGTMRAVCWCYLPLARAGYSSFVQQSSFASFRWH